MTFPRLLHPRAAFAALFLFGLACCAFASRSAAAGPAPADKAGPGRVTGRVSNQATGELLSGAVVRARGTAVSALTDRNGAYTLSLPAGGQLLDVTFTGLDPAALPVAVVAGQTVSADVPLTSAVYKLDKFTVKGLREGSEDALQQQRTAVNPVIVAATDTFGTPAANPGELLQRLPNITTAIVGSEVRTIYIRGMDPSFGALMVDGNQMAVSSGTSASRVFQIEQMGTGDIESAEVVFAPTPDMDANAISGYVNLITKRTFDTPGQRVDLTLGTIWRERPSRDNPYQDNPGGPDIIGVRYSNAFSVLGGKNNLGVAFNFNRRVSSTTQDEIGDGDQQSAAGAFLLTNPANPLQVVFGGGDFYYKATAINLGFNVDYKLNGDSYAYVRSFFNTNDQEQHALEEATSTTNNIASFQAGSTTADEVALPIAASQTNTWSFLQTKKSQNYSINPGVHYKLFGGSGTLDVNGLYSHAVIWYPGYTFAEAGVTGVGWSLTRSDADQGWYPTFTQTSGPDIYNAANYKPSTAFRETWNAPDAKSTVRADYRQDFRTAVPTFVKFGGKYMNDEFSQNVNYGAGSWAGPTGQGIGQYLGYQYKQEDGHYGPFPFLQFPGSGQNGDIMQSGNFATTAAQAYTNVVNSTSGDATLQESIAAAYVEGGITIGPVDLLGGLRTEQTNTKGSALVRNTSAAFASNSALAPAQNAALALASFSPYTAWGSYKNVFPEIQLLYEPLEGLQARASYNASIARPPIASVLPIVSQNLDANTITIGNPNLRPYRSDNFEFSLSRYFEPVGLIQAGVFLKQITNYFQSVTSVVGPGPDNGFDGQFAGFTLSHPVNTGNARVRGVYFSYQQQYSFLPGPLSGLGSFANWTFLETQGNYGTNIFQEYLANFTPSSGNVGLSYVYSGLQARLMANYRGRYYLSGSGTTAVFDEPRMLLDLKLQYTINRTFDVFFDAANLTDTATRADVIDGVPYYADLQGIGFDAGVKMRFR